jgi:hypothetical protein
LTAAIFLANPWRFTNKFPSKNPSHTIKRCTTNQP